MGELVFDMARRAREIVADDRGYREQYETSARFKSAVDALTEQFLPLLQRTMVGTQVPIGDVLDVWLPTMVRHLADEAMVADARLETALRQVLADPHSPFAPGSTCQCAGCCCEGRR